jgi:hypothetical protein
LFKTIGFDVSLYPQVKQFLTEEALSAVRYLSYQIAGVGLQPEFVRNYPTIEEFESSFDLCVGNAAERPVDGFAGVNYSNKRSRMISQKTVLLHFGIPIRNCYRSRSHNVLVKSANITSPVHGKNGWRWGARRSKQAFWSDLWRCLKY